MWFWVILSTHFVVQFGQNHNRTAPQFCNHIYDAVVYQKKKKKKKGRGFWCGVQGVVWSVLGWYIFQDGMTSL